MRYLASTGRRWPQLRGAKGAKLPELSLGAFHAYGPQQTESVLSSELGWEPLEPSFPTGASADCLMNGLEVLPVPWDKAEIDPARLLLDEPDLVYLCRPNNPTGSSLSRDWVRALLALGGPDGPLVLLDEAYADFADAPDFPDSRALLKKRERRWTRLHCVRRYNSWPASTSRR